ncbi:MarR family transcriptional regulator [Pantoea cypripedii]|uniref:MarR family winged helix-turn-helix transcriptional regulator n=1 Tax=Pantoea cypripedii TaxID=55209 RepID=UPI002FCC550F
MKNKPGLGELLRYVAELVDKGSEETYRGMSLNYRPRYTPVLRAMQAGAVTVQEITASSHLTQGAISQSVALMEQDGIILREQLSDGRSAALKLTAQGKELVSLLERHWEAIFVAISELEQDAGWPVLDGLKKLAAALETKSFAERIRDAGAGER